MRLDPAASINPKICEKRRGARLNSRVPVFLEWQNDAGHQWREGAFTRVIGPYGCLVVLPQLLDKNQRLNVVNASTEQSNAATVVWNGKQVGEGWELGIELKEPPMDFWGMEL